MKFASIWIRVLFALLLAFGASPGCEILPGSGGDLGLGSEASDDSDDDGDVEEEDEEEEPAPYGRIFVTTGTVDGMIVWTPGGTTYEPLDDLCQSEADTMDLDWWGRGTVAGTQGHYRAVVALAAQTSRIACTTANCVTDGTDEHVGKWPLKPEREYFREDGITPIGTTNAEGLFDFPLQNSVSASASYVWTGLNADWTTYGGTTSNGTQNCFSNISNSVGWGQYGLANATGASAFAAPDPVSTGQGTCSTTYPIVCAEVLPTILPTQPSYRKIFATTNTYGITFMGSKAQLDAACQSEANASGLGFDGKASYKALIQSPTQRIALYALGVFVAGPIDWIMDANREYRRADGTTVIGTTNAQAVLDFPLTNSMTGAADAYWTGFGRTDMFYSGNPAHPFSVFNVANTPNETCANYSSINGGITGRVGDGSSTSESAFGAGLAACDSQQKLLCVEQTRANVFYE